MKLSKYRALLPYIIAQSKVETADLTSHVYDVDNNLFGMKDAVKRPETSDVKGTRANDGGFYKHYRTDTESIRDLFLWMDYTKFPKSVSSLDEYNKQLVQRSYYTAPEGQYLANLKLYYG